MAIPIPEDILAGFELTDRLLALSVADKAEVREAMREVWRLRQWCHEAQSTRAAPSREQHLDQPPGSPPLKWPTGVSQIDDKTGGGAYGFTCIAGEPKSGKSMLAMSMAIEAAREGWRVWYCNAELSEYAISNRVGGYLGEAPKHEFIDQFTMLHTERGINVGHILERLDEKLSIDDRQWLIVIDSVNRIVAQSTQAQGSDNAYWRNLEQWSEFFRMAAKLSGGRVSSVVVSELNAAGFAKGRGLEYAADLLIKMAREGDEDGYVMISIPQARSSAGGPLGKFWIDWKTGRFVYVGDQ